MTYADAVQNGYISKSEYNYQIAGELKSAIEEKMGRPLDYSVDSIWYIPMLLAYQTPHNICTMPQPKMFMWSIQKPT